MSKTVYTNAELIALLQTNKEQAIEIIFRQYYAYLCKTVYNMIGNSETAEDLVQEVFLSLWKKESPIKINTSIGAYLKRAAINRTLNHLRSQKMQIVSEEQSPILQTLTTTEQTDQTLETTELAQTIQQAIHHLPPRCRVVFSLSRYENMKYQEIADQLNISIKTVENQISKALKILRQTLQPFLSWAVWCLFFW